MRYLYFLWCLLLTGMVAEAQTFSGTLAKWHNVIMTFDGVSTCETSSPNPFTDYRLIVTFTKGSKTYVVPGYFAADGDAANTGATCGDKWRVHFIPDEAGSWNYSVSYRTGSNVAVSDDANAGSAQSPVNGMSGSFNVIEINRGNDDFRSKGKLRYAGLHHLRFDNGTYFLKGGTDSPENFLAYWEFDGTVDDGGPGAGLPNGLHRYPDHVQDWNASDPSWMGGKGKGIIGALNYLAEQGLNSVYMLTMNIGGDGDDVWPYTSPTVFNRFDVSKLSQWEIVFSHMDILGLMLHIVTQERENETMLDNGNLGNLRRLYYRELIARFGHHLAITWNLGEENGRGYLDRGAQNTNQRKAMATYFKEHDPYNSFVTVHNYTPEENSLFNPLLGYADFDGTSLQQDRNVVNGRTINWRDASTNAGRRWVVCHDETTGGISPDGSSSNHDVVRKMVLWGNYMAGGGGVEWFFGGSADYGAETFRTREELWGYTKVARDFFYNHTRFWVMEPNNSLTSASNDFCLAEPGNYVIYLPNGGSTNINLPGGTYDIKWYDAKVGGSLLTGSKATTNGGNVSIGNSPYPGEDWAVLITVSSGGPGPCSQIEVTSFTLVHAGTAGDIGPLTNGTVINLSTIGGFSIRANVCDGGVGSVQFRLNGSIFRTESVPPFAINGDTPAGSYTPWNPAPGSYTLIGTPYSGSNSTGTAGISDTVTFTVIGQAPGCTDPQDCNDNNPCTIDSCNSGQCVNVFINCNDNDPCTNDQCNDGVCSNVPLNCSDNNPCTMDSCGNGLCFNIPFDCNDNDPCTIDVCNGTGTCSHLPDPGCNGDCVNLEVVSFVMVDAFTGAIIDTLGNGTVIDPAFEGSFSIVAITCSGPVGSVEFILNGTSTQIENVLPYALFGDNPDGTYIPWNPAPGDYTLTAIPYVFQNAGGRPGISLTVTFTVSDLLPGCVFDSECDDDDPCTLDACNNMLCVYQFIPGCLGPCVPDCDDGNSCTVDVFGSDGSCHNSAITENPDYIRVRNFQPSWRKLKIGYDPGTLWYPPQNVVAGGNNQVCLTLRAVGKPEWNKILFRPQNIAGLGVALSNYLPGVDTCTFDDWFTLCIPLSDFPNVNFTDETMVEFPYSNLAGAFEIHILRIEFTGGTTPFLWFGDTKTDNSMAGSGSGGSELLANLVQGASCGSSKQSEIISGEVQPIPERVVSFTAYPNPFANRVTLEFISALQGKAKIEIVNAVGSIVKSETLEVSGGENKTSISFEHELPAGIYLVKLEMNGLTEYRKLYKSLD